MYKILLIYCCCSSFVLSLPRSKGTVEDNLYLKNHNDNKLLRTNYKVNDKNSSINNFVKFSVIGEYSREVVNKRSVNENIVRLLKKQNIVENTKEGHNKTVLKKNSDSVSSEISKTSGLNSLNCKTETLYYKQHKINEAMKSNRENRSKREKHERSRVKNANRALKSRSRRETSEGSILT